MRNGDLWRRRGGHAARYTAITPHTPHDVLLEGGMLGVLVVDRLLVLDAVDVVRRFRLHVHRDQPVGHEVMHTLEPLVGHVVLAIVE